MFLETTDGLINSRFIILIDSAETLAEDGKTAWIRIEYLAGMEVRETSATPEDVSNFLTAHQSTVA